MDQLWRAEQPLLVREILDRINAVSARPLAYTTVQTVADRLVRKGLAARVLDGVAYRYQAVRSREEHVAELMLDALSGSDDRSVALARFAELVDPRDARQLLEALAERKSAGRGTDRRPPRS